MKLAYITNLRAPYRTLQLNEFSNIKDIELTTYYTDKPDENRKWNVNDVSGFEEIDLKGHKLFKKYGYINKGLLAVVKNSDLIMLGCYEQPTYIALSIFCKALRKPYVLSFDGISTDRLGNKENIIKKVLKKIVICNADYIMGNGTVSKRYFNEVFNYPLERIYNQYLTVDSVKINGLYCAKKKYRNEYRKKYNLEDNEKVLIYSGRLIDIKNVDTVIKALRKLKKPNLTLLITGGGLLEEELKGLANELNVKMIVTGFISEQEELFKHYFVGDALILPSKNEVWGLAVNEAMMAELPILVSEICGCSLDLVNDGENGYIINPYDVDDISNKIYKLLYEDDLKTMGERSKKIIGEWTFENSKNNLMKILNFISIDEVIQ